MIIVPASAQYQIRVSEFIGNFLGTIQCPKRDRLHVVIAVDEIFSNIVRHVRGEETVTVLIHEEEDPRAVEITFADTGIPFDPLSAAEPDVTAPAQKRQIGGLGLFMLKRIMDEVFYEYRDEKNILTVRKYL